jgi:hypothetical protein
MATERQAQSMSGKNEKNTRSIKNISSDEIKRRIDEVRTGRVKTIPGETVLRQIAKEFDQPIRKKKTRTISKRQEG